VAALLARLEHGVMRTPACSEIASTSSRLTGWPSTSVAGTGTSM
jgi:hypothetical protein